MSEMRFMPESLASELASSEIPGDSNSSDCAPLEPARPFTMPSARRPLRQSGGLLAGVLLCIMLLSGCLLAWSALATRDNAAAAPVAHSQLEDAQRDGGLAQGNRPSEADAGQLQRATSADALS